MQVNSNNGIVISEFYQLMKKHEIIMVYEGEFSQEITKSFLSMTESTFHSAQVNETVIKKVYNIMMEVLQNICKHEFKHASIHTDKVESILIIAENKTEYQIVTGNAIKKNSVSIIKNKIDTINSLDQEGLKALYKQARLNSTISEVGGAGLGFIDIARKSGNPISYHFSPINEELVFFTQMVTVNKQL